MEQNLSKFQSVRDMLFVEVVLGINLAQVAQAQTTLGPESRLRIWPSSQ